MVRSRRTKEISLTATSRKGRGGKERLLQKLRTLSGLNKMSKTSFSNILVIGYTNFNNKCQAKLREFLHPTSRVVFGKKSIVRLFFSELMEQNHLDKDLMEAFVKDGLAAVVFTNMVPDALRTRLESFKVIEFAQPGAISPANVVLTKGEKVFAKLSASNVDYLRLLGLDVDVKNGQLLLVNDFLAATKGEKLESHQCKLLKLLGLKIGKANICVRAAFDKVNLKLNKYA